MTINDDLDALRTFQKQTGPWVVPTIRSMITGDAERWACYPSTAGDIMRAAKTV